MRRALILTIVVLATVSCGSSNDATTASTTTSTASATTQTSTTPSPVPDLEVAVRAYTASYLGGDAPGARSLLSQRCQAAIAETDFAAAVTQAATLYGAATITRYTDQVDGAIATATYELSDPTLNQTDERWLLVDGAWRNDDC